MALELGLTHPLTATHTLGNGDFDAVAGRNLIFRGDAAGPVGAGVPGFHIQGGGSPQIPVLVLLEDDVLSDDGGAHRAAAKVKDKHHVVTGLGLREVVLTVHERFSGREFHLTVIEERMYVVLLFGVVGELDGHRHVFIGQEGDAEVILRVCRGSNVALELGLAHPLAAAHSFGNGDFNAVAGRDFIFRGKAAGPVATGVPGFHFHIGGLPEVGVSVQVVTGGVQGLHGSLGIVRIHRADVLTVLGLEDELPGDDAFEGRNQHQLFGRVLLDVQPGGRGEHLGTGNVCEENAGREFNIVSLVVGTQDIGGFLELGGSIVVSGTVSGILVALRQITGFPVAIDHSVLAGIEDIFTVLEEGDFVIGHAKGILVVRVGAPPSGRIGYVRAAAHITLGLIVQNPDLAVITIERIGLSYNGTFGNKLVVPGNTVGVIRSEHGGHQLELFLHVGSIAFHNQVTGLFHSALVGHIGHLAAGFQHQVDFLDTGIVPVVLKGVPGGLELGGEKVVFIGRLGFRLVLGTLVGIGLAVAGIEGIVAFCVEGHGVVIQEAGLAVGFAGPPTQRIAHGAAAEVTVLRVVPDPGLGSTSGDGTDVRGRIEGIAVGIVQGKGFYQGTLGKTVGVVSFYLNGVLTLFAEAEGNTVYGIGIALGSLPVNLLISENPHGNHPLIVHRKGDIVGFLIHRNGDIQLGGLRQASLAQFGILRFASGRRNSQRRNGDILPDSFHRAVY